MGQALSKTHQDDETSSAFNDSVVSATHSDISFDSLNKQGKLKSKGNKIQFKPKSSLSGSYEVIDTPEKASSFGNLGNMSMSSSRMSSLNNSMTSCDEFEILNYEGSPKHYRTWRRQKNAAAQKNKEVGSKKDVCNTPVKPSDVSSGMDSFVLVDTPKVAEELQKYDTGQKIKDVATVEQGNGITVSHGKSGKSVVTNSRHGVGIDNGVSADKSMKARGVASIEKTKSNVSSVKVETTQSVKFSTVRETDLDVVIHNSPKPITTQLLCSSPASSQQPTPIDKYGKSSRRANSLDNRTRNTPSQIMDLSGQIDVRDQKLAEKLNRSVPNVVASSSSFQKRTDSYVTPDEMKQKRKTASLYGTLPRKKAITGGVKATDLDAIEQLNLSPGAYTSKKSTDDQFNFPRSMRHFFLSPVSSHTSISWDTKDQPQSSLTPNYKGNKSLVTSSSIQSQSVAVSSSHVQTQPVAVTSTPVQNQSVAVKISPMQTQPVAVTRSPMQTQSLAVTSSEVQSQPVAVTRSPMQTQSLAVTSLEVQSQPVAVTSSPVQSQPVVVTNSHVQSQPVAVTSSHVQSQSFAQSKVMNVSSNPVLKMNKDTRIYGRDGADSTENCNAARGGLPVRVSTNISDKKRISHYVTTEWKGNTVNANAMRKGYGKILSLLECDYLRIIRGDNYCAVRAPLYQSLVNDVINIKLGHDLEKITQVPDWFISSGYHWVSDWSFAHRFGDVKNTVQTMKHCLRVLEEQILLVRNTAVPADRETLILDAFNTTETDLYLVEAVKILMLYNAIRLYEDNTTGKEVPVFVWLMYARDSSSNPQQLMRNHLNSVGDSAGVEQVEMFLMGYTLGVTLKVVRPSQVEKDDFITYYPDDHFHDWNKVVLIAEDDRHYNIALN